MVLSDYIEKGVPAEEVVSQYLSYSQTLFIIDEQLLYIPYIIRKRFSTSN